MTRRGFWKQEVLIVLLLIAVLGGLAVTLTLFNGEKPTPGSYVDKASGGVMDASIPVPDSVESKLAVGISQDVPEKEQREITNESGLKYIDRKIGGGDKVKIGSVVMVYYTGKLKNGGEEVDSNIGRQPYTVVIGAGDVIKGWEEGLLGMKGGGKRKLFIPYQLAYGEKGKPPKVPGKADLVFDIEVIKVTNR